MEELQLVVLSNQGQRQGQGQGQGQGGEGEGADSRVEGSVSVLLAEQGAEGVSVLPEGVSVLPEGRGSTSLASDESKSTLPLALTRHLDLDDDPTNLTPPLPPSNTMSNGIPPPSPSCDDRDEGLSSSGGSSGVGDDVAGAIERAITRLRTGITADLQTQTSPMNSSTNHHQLRQNAHNYNDVQSQTQASSSSSSSSSSDENKEEKDTHLYHENVILKTRITELVSQEKDMFISLTQRLHELDEARTKLLRLKKSTHQHGLFVQDDTTVWGNGSMDTPLRDTTTSHANKENFTSPPTTSLGKKTHTSNTPSRTPNTLSHTLIHHFTYSIITPLSQVYLYP